MEKALSPLVSAVLLIAFTVAVGGIISIWVTGFAKSKTKQVGEQAELDILCARAGISFRELNFCNNYLSGKFTNTGFINLGSLRMEILYIDASRESFDLCLSNGKVVKCETSNLTVMPREVFAFNLSIKGSNYEIIRLITNCTGATDEVYKSDVFLLC